MVNQTKDSLPRRLDKPDDETSDTNETHPIAVESTADGHAYRTLTHDSLPDGADPRVILPPDDGGGIDTKAE